MVREQIQMVRMISVAKPNEPHKVSRFNKKLVFATVSIRPVRSEVFFFPLVRSDSLSPQKWNKLGKQQNNFTKLLFDVKL